MCDRESLIARCLLLLHRYRAAQTHLVAALKIHPDHLPLLSLYILALSAPPDEASRDVRSAKTVLEKIRSTRFPLVHAAAVAMIQAAEGKFEEAVASQSRALTLAIQQNEGDQQPALQINLKRYQNQQLPTAFQPRGSPDESRTL